VEDHRRGLADLVDEQGIVVTDIDLVEQPSGKFALALDVFRQPPSFQEFRIPRGRQRHDASREDRRQPACPRHRVDQHRRRDSEGQEEVVADPLPDVCRCSLPGDQVPAALPAAVDAFGMLNPGIVRGKHLAHGFEGPDAVFALVRFFRYAGIRRDDGLHAVGAQALGLDRCGAGHDRMELAEHGVHGAGRKKAQDVRGQGAGCLRKPGKPTRLPGDVGIAGLADQHLVKTIDLALRQPVAAVLQVEGRDARVLHDLVDIDIGVEGLQVLDVVPGDLAIVQRNVFHDIRRIPCGRTTHTSS